MDLRADLHAPASPRTRGGSAARKRQPPSLAYVERINRAIDYLTSHLAGPLRLDDVARAAHLSPFHFHRVFQALVGETPADFVKRLRLERALALMTQARRPSFTQIALACGFSSSSDFSRCFRQRFGVPPRAFDLAHWQREHRAQLQATVPAAVSRPSRPEEAVDGFRVKLCERPARTVAYIRVRNPYRGDGVQRAAQRLVAWAERHSLADGRWLGYQWENPDLVSLKDCQYHIAVEAERFVARGEIGSYRFAPMLVAQLEMRGGVDLALRALDWLYGTWLPQSGYVPDDQPCFEAFIGRPFAHGTEYFELSIELPLRRGN